MKSINPDYPALVKEVRRQLAYQPGGSGPGAGVSYATVNRWENDQAKPSKLARAQLDAFCERMQAAEMLSLSEAGRG